MIVYSTADTLVDELPGQIGPYEVRDRLGQGGMGVVYLGFDPMLDRPVAIKVLKVPDEETRRRFLREARLAAKVHHPHIVSIYAVGEHEGNPYLAMEFIAGRTMAQIIRDGGDVPLARKVHWLSELCAGLGHAHESGIVHRDVKPSNLLIAQSTGTLRLLDFGIAHGNEASGMTMVGMIVGTPQYMSPEQITGQQVDFRSDIFSVGTVAYELLTGRQAFGGDNLYGVSKQIVGEQPRPIESVVPDVPQALVRAIASCLQKDPATRAVSAKVLEREFLSIARRLDPDHTLVVRPADPTVVAKPRDVTTSRVEMLREAEAAIAQGQLTTASGLLQKLESGTVPSPDVQQVRLKLQERRTELRINEALGKADEAAQSGSLEEAEAAINALAQISPRHEALERLRHRLQERLDERQVASLTSRARQAIHQDRLDEAEALIAEALALAPDAPDALSVRQRLSERNRAQRIARLVAQASRALESDDVAEARRAVAALVALDPSHRDVARLQARLGAVAAESAEHARPEPPPPPAASAPSPAPPPAAAPLEARKDGPAAAAPPPPARVPPAAAPAAAPSAPAASAGADGLLLRSPAPGVQAGTAPPAKAAAKAPPTAPPEGAGGRSWLIPVVAAVILLAAAAGGYYQFVVAPGRAAQTATATDGDATTTPPAGEAAVPAEAGTEPNTATAETPPGTPDAKAGGAAAGPAAGPANAAATPSSPTADPWADVRQLARSGRYDRAMSAIEQVRGVSPEAAQQERGQLIETARRNSLAARRGAEDLRLTASPQFVLGMSSQAQAERDMKAGRPGPAVSGYMQARGHFLQAINDSGKGPSPTTAAAESAATSTPAPSATPEAPAKTEPEPVTTRVDLSTWSNEEARASIAQFCGAYLGRDLGGLNRLWPNMEPAWRKEFQEAFATEGELVCVFESVTLVRTSDEFNASARLLTQLPGGAQRRRNLAMTLVPSRDRLVIGNIRVR